MWSLALVARETRLVVGSSDRQLRVWAVEHADVEQEMGGAISRATIGQKRVLFSADVGGEMTQNDVTGNYGRNVRNIQVAICYYGNLSY